MAFKFIGLLDLASLRLGPLVKGESQKAERIKEVENPKVNLVSSPFCFALVWILKPCRISWWTAS